MFIKKIVAVSHYNNRYRTDNIHGLFDHFSIESISQGFRVRNTRLCHFEEIVIHFKTRFHRRFYRIFIKNFQIICNHCAKIIQSDIFRFVQSRFNHFEIAVDNVSDNFGQPSDFAAIIDFECG